MIATPGAAVDDHDHHGDHGHADDSDAEHVAVAGHDVVAVVDHVAGMAKFVGPSRVQQR